MIQLYIIANLIPFIMVSNISEMTYFLLYFMFRNLQVNIKRVSLEASELSFADRIFAELRFSQPTFVSLIFLQIFLIEQQK